MRSRRALCGWGTRPLARRLTERYRDRVTDSPYERSFYTRDLAPMPQVMDWVFATTPDVLVRPGSAEEVSEVVRRAVRSFPRSRTECGCSDALKHGLITAREAVPTELVRRLEPILGKYFHEPRSPKSSG